MLKVINVTRTRTVTTNPFFVSTLLILDYADKDAMYQLLTRITLHIHMLQCMHTMSTHIKYGAVVHAQYTVISFAFW